MNDEMKELYMTLNEMSESKREMLKEIIKNYLEMSKENQKKFLKIVKLLNDIQGLPLEEQQKIIDDSKDDDIIELLNIYKSTLS